MSRATRWLWAACAAAVLAVAPAVRAGISISPAYVELTLDKGRPSGHFVISNLGDTEERYRIQAIHFTFLENGGMQQGEPDGHSMALWIRFNPREFVLAPKTKQVVRFIILPRGKLEPGEYWAGMELESLKTQVGTGTDASGRTFGVEVVPTILVPIFGTVGAVERKGTLDEIDLTASPQGPVVEALVTNAGTGRLLMTGTFHLTDAEGRTVWSGPLGYGYIFRDGRRRFKAAVERDLPAGRYKLKVEYKTPELPEPLTMEKTVELGEAILVHKDAAPGGDAAGKPETSGTPSGETETPAPAATTPVNDKPPTDKADDRREKPADRVPDRVQNDQAAARTLRARI